MKGSQVVGLLMLLGLIFFGLVFQAFFPHFWTDYKMGECVQVALLDWRDTNNMEKGMARLEHELNKREIPEYITMEDCEAFAEGDEKHMRCSWSIEVKWPVLDKWEQFDYGAHKYVVKNNQREVFTIE